jgi:hypothetical protein
VALRRTAPAFLGLAAALAVLAAAPAVPAEEPDPAPILVSRQLAHERDLAAGDVVLLAADPSGDGARPFRIEGIYEPVPDPFRLTARRLEARLHLPDLLGLVADPADPSAAEEVTAVSLALEDPGEAPELARELAARLPGVVAVPTVPADGGPTLFLVLERFHQAIAAVAVGGATAFLLALMVMRADERRETAGILRLIGLRRRRILAEVLLEGLAVAAAGAAFGVAFAVALEGAVNRFFQWHYDTALVFVRVTPGIAARSVALALPLGVLAGLVASWTLLSRGILALVRR